MKKKVYSAILKLYELPIFFDREDFYDKSISFLYMQFKFKDIEGISKEELDVDLSLFDNGAMAVILQDSKAQTLSKKNISDIKEVKKVIICVDRSEMKDFLSFRIGKTALAMFGDSKDLKLFFSNIEEFFNHQEKNFKSIKSFLIKQKHAITISKEKDSSRDVSHADDKSSFLQVTAKNMPEKIKLPQSLEKAEAALIKEMLRRTKGKKVDAAVKLGITERMIGYKIKKYGLG